MSAFSGPQANGARRQRRKDKRAAAETRNAATPRERTKAFRREQARLQSALSPAERALLRASLRPSEEGGEPNGPSRRVVVAAAP